MHVRDRVFARARVLIKDESRPPPLSRSRAALGAGISRSRANTLVSFFFFSSTIFSTGSISVTAAGDAKTLATSFVPVVATFAIIGFV
jgi:hypothetical protein